ncbi:MAG: CRTAC1 family protein [Alphaproteobacteria bacterium]|nr:CRTAC1 family protein [Alphaproteobacteria bacterium]
MVLWLLGALVSCDRSTVEDDSAPAAAPVCEAPEARAEAPFDLVDGGPDWRDRQRYAPLESGRVAAGGISAADLDGDGRVDLVLPAEGGVQIFMAQPDGTFIEETEGRFDDRASVSTAVSLVDVDGDGDLDLFHCQMGGPSVLHLNDGGGVFEKSEAEFPETLRACMGSSWGDMDGDGDLDLFLASSMPCDAPTGATDPAACGAEYVAATPHALFENLGDGTFADVTERLDVDALHHGAMHIGAWVDLDDDGDLDLVVVNDRMNQYSFLSPNLAWRNDGAGGFTDVGAETGLDLRIEGMGLGLGDLNGDGLPDLLISGSARLALLASAADGRWYDEATARGLVPSFPRVDAWGAELVDLDNDGDLDAPVLYGWTPPDVTETNPLEQPDALWIQGDGMFTDAAEAWGFGGVGVGRGLTAADLNGDGWLDLLARDYYGPARLYQARCGAAAWLTVSLDGPAPNVDGVGAKVTVEAGGATQVRWIVAGGTGLFGSAPPLAHFGLGDARSVDRLTVRWPDGQETTLEDIAVSQRVEVRQ